ncbi:MULTISPECIES: hypothetical protein [unclassified Mesorhizobium]|uniref:hypothetical protein n=1 Tax=unclassified Mesorhizobium TaxID=325217 RepID=UPI001FE07EFA|nr:MULTISPECIES: hypothetical protein [unclassified Mesorhizobium]
MLKPNSPSNPSLLTRLGGNEIWPVAAVLVAGCLVLTFGLLAEEVLEGDTSRFDMTVLMALRSGGNPANPIGPARLGEMGRDVTSLGSFAFLGFIFAATVGYLLLIRNTWASGSDDRGRARWGGHQHAA